ncbi:unnamed protein product [Amoebophrya sp. A120]|nr:unnamed protein product [Amoebophrya sp. A120]|eukprot:GSA120T00001391001.1
MTTTSIGTSIKRRTTSLSPDREIIYTTCKRQKMSDPVDLLASLKYENDDGVFQYESHEALPDTRRNLYARLKPDPFAGGDPIYSVTAKGEDGTIREFFVLCRPGAGADPEILTHECGITAMDVCPSELVEYQFEKPCDEWNVSVSSKDGIDMYLQSKFGAWHKQLHNPTCEAEFRRMLQNGLVTTMYDRMLFKTPDALKEKYEVVDERNGKTLHLPHPVAALRIWDPAAKTYTPIDPRLPGAPPAGEEEKYWTELLDAFRKERGEEYINSMFTS